MTFVKRAIKLSFKLASGSLPNGADTLDLEGHRVEAIIDNPGGGLAVGSLNMRVYGMRLADMNTFSTDGLNALAVRGDSVTVSAGNEGGQIHQVFEGTITAAFIDFAGIPDVAFNVQAQAGFLFKVKPAAPNEGKGTVDVAAKIQTIAASIGFGFKNNGVTSQLSNQYLYGTAIDQIRTLADAARIACNIENGIVSIWPNNGLSDSTILSISPDNGMVGYPAFTPTGIAVRAEFRPEMQLGRTVRVKSLIAKACGDWKVQSMRHELSTMTPGGPWFSTCSLTQSGLYVSS
ncbi:baseplate hub protein [Curvibacter lanceolatus]|uniref:baseplate hub protein n=1 Tax=Curvibacter lanceolatus TaxID=86182 RepID=UPI00036EE08C|nr:hypothetical protein [Curvibacter lanceolatus]